MPNDPEKNCNSHCSGILLARDIFGEDVEPAFGFQPTKGQHISVPPGESLFSAGTAPAAIFVITSGQVLIVNNDGISTTIHAGANAEPVFGMLESLSDTTFDINLTAVTECGVSVYKADEIFDHVRRSPELSFRLAEVVAGLYVQTVRAAREL
jgi:CRP-like cAMP-binding protein